MVAQRQKIVQRRRCKNPAGILGHFDSCAQKKRAANIRGAFCKIS